MEKDLVRLDNKVLNNLLVEHKGILKEISALQKKVTELTTKRSQLEKGIELLQKSSRKDLLAQELSKLAEKFMAEHISEDVYEQEKAVLNQRGDELEEKVRFLDATKRLLNKVTSEIGKSSQKGVSLRYQVYQCLFQSEQEEILTLLGNKVSLAWAIAVNMNLTYDNFLRLLFPEPPREEMIALGDETRKRIFGDE